MDLNNPKQSIQNPNSQINQSPQPIQAPIQNLNRNQDQVQDKKSSSNKYIFLWVLVGIIVFILILIGIYFFLISNKDNDLKMNDENQPNSSNTEIKKAQQVVKINTNDIDPYQLALELYEKGNNLEYKYFKKKTILLNGQSDIIEIWHYKDFIKIKDKSGIAIWNPDKGAYFREYGGRGEFTSIEEPGVGALLFPFSLSLMHMHYESNMKDNLSLSLIDASKDENNMLIYKYRYKNSINDDVETMWILENGFVLKLEREDDKTKKITITEAVIDYSFKPYPLSTFDIPK